MKYDRGNHFKKVMKLVLLSTKNDASLYHHFYDELKRPTASLNIFSTF